MPIYEFYCDRCNTVYKFLSRTVNTEKIPDCPACRDIKLKRRMSLFSAVSGRKEGDDADADLPVNEATMEKAMSMLAKEAEKIKDDDPRQAAQLMRKLSDVTGMKMGDGMEEALRRLEGGEDPEHIEKEMGDILNGEEPFTFGDSGKKGGRKGKPKINDTLYEL